MVGSVLKEMLSPRLFYHQRVHYSVDWPIDWSTDCSRCAWVPKWSLRTELPTLLLGTANIGPHYFLVNYPQKCVYVSNGVEKAVGSNFFSADDTTPLPFPRLALFLTSPCLLLTLPVGRSFWYRLYCSHLHRRLCRCSCRCFCCCCYRC